MRSIRTTRNVRNMRAKQPVLGVTVKTDTMKFSMFEDFIPETVKMVDGVVKLKRPDAPEEKPNFTMLGVYNEEDFDNAAEGYDGYGLISISTFRDTLAGKRLAYRTDAVSNNQEKRFNLCLLVNEKVEENEKSYQVISIDFIFTPNNGQCIETANITVYNEMEDMTQAIPRRIKELYNDSDPNSSLYRFLKNPDWHQTTYGILDFNKNLQINKSVHVVLDTPFNCNMNWYSPNRRLVYGYCIYEPIDPNTQP